MWRIMLATGLIPIAMLIARTPASSQASKKLEEKAKGMEQGQQKSWQQVDEINRQTDKTKARYQQSQQQSSVAPRKTANPVTKTKVGTATSGHKKPPVVKKAPKKK